MKYDNEPIYAHSTLASRSDSHFFSYDDNCVKTTWKVDSEIMGEDKRKIVSDRSIKRLDTNNEQLITQEEIGEAKNVPRLHEFLAMENSIDGRAKETEDPFSSNGDKLYEKEFGLYTDKSVTESELPELIVCFKEFEPEDYHVVKDICIDDGLPSDSKVLVENAKVHNEEDLSSMHSELDVNTDLTEENVENEGPILDGTNPFVECDSKTDVTTKYGYETLYGSIGEDFEETVNFDSAVSSFRGTNPFVECDTEADVAKKCGSESLLKNRVKNFNESEIGDSEARISNGTNPFLESDSDEDVATKCGYESTTGNSKDNFNEIVSAITDEKTTPGALLPKQELDVCNSPEPSNLDRNGNLQESEQDTRHEANSADSMIPPAAEESNNCNQGKEDPINDDVERGSITEGFDSLSPETIGREEDLDKPDCRQSVETLNMPSIVEETTDTLSASSRSFFIQHGYGETSFSLADPLSGPIAYSGPIPYSGSISLRSDSSTTSTRSFAFPILHSEWNSSPVKMAKARKHRGWRLSLLCCRF
ncbi:18S pre-ribosomal assembly protein gar2-like protein [Thalictrum thalictroides]|uniref:18S pre-ribosomal assembly protein gar2-like protein n=1 Tax=Thalictrum thalictroides TaxID=46969 RepID=A0A7J6VIP8_THATH|nr:18S pre-ribosomal assembly protein gar2-like protein [Thalictrum thalictroides]